MVIGASITAASVADYEIQIQVSNSFFNQLILGDIVRFNQGNSMHYGYVYSLSGDEIFVKIIGANFPATGAVSELQLTKNPPYNKDFYDMWGFYKCDYMDMEDNNLERTVTEISQQSVDVWSLREIQSSLGAKTKIKYASDSYASAALQNDFSMHIQSAVKTAVPNEVRINFYGDYDLDEAFTAGKNYSVITLSESHYRCEVNQKSPSSAVYSATVKNIFADYILVESFGLSHQQITVRHRNHICFPEPK